MDSKAISGVLSHNLAQLVSVELSQRWVLSAMSRYGQSLIAMLWRILGNEQDVCDAYQDTFLRLAHYKNNGKPEHIKAYVFRTAGNAAITMLRRKLIEAKSINVVAQNISTAKTVDCVAELDAKYLQQHLRCAIAKLPEYLRNVIIFRDLAELSYVQVGKILGISAATARVYRHKAVQLLSVWMKEE
jgi:RNA polymerase sigma factor (sigma-70 family)